VLQPKVLNIAALCVELASDVTQFLVNMNVLCHFSTRAGYCEEISSLPAARNWIVVVAEEITG
jgi:hypothetical protein